MLKDHNCGELRISDAGKDVKLAGWVESVRIQGKIGFLLLRDGTGIIQCFLNPKLSAQLKDVSRESVVAVSGKVNKRPDNQIKKDMATGEVELEAKEATIVSLAETPLPINIDLDTTTGLDKRLDFRFLDMHRAKVQAIFKIQNVIANAFREHFYKKGFVEMQPPCIISAASEGGTELFPVKYFEKDAYLAQSPQLYKQMLACSVEKIVMITPVWRAEKHNTPRHINEIRQMDIEVAFMDQMEIMHELEFVIKFIVENVIKNCENELKILNVKNLKVPKGIYLSYDEAIKRIKGKYGEDLTPEQEKELCALYPDDIVFVHSWPSSIKPFYIMPKDGKADSKISEGFDAIYGGIEISSGGQRIHLPELLIKRLEMKGLDPDDFKYYVDSFRYGAPPHSGWSIGLERITQIICGLDNVKEATMFPRDRDRLMP